MIGAGLIAFDSHCLRLFGSPLADAAPRAGDRVIAFQHLHDHGAGDHERDQVVEERAGLVHAVEGLGLGLAHLDALLRDDAQAGLLDHGVDRAGQVTLGRVGLDDRKRALNRHNVVLGGAGFGWVAGLYRRDRLSASDRAGSERPRVTTISQF